MLDEVTYRARTATRHSIASSAVKESDLRTPKTSCCGTTYTHLIPAQRRPASGSSKPGKLYSGWQYCDCTDLRQKHVTALPAVERWGYSFLYTDTAEPPMIAYHTKQCSSTYKSISYYQAAERARYEIVWQNPSKKQSQPNVHLWLTTAERRVARTAGLPSLLAGWWPRSCHPCWPASVVRWDI